MSISVTVNTTDISAAVIAAEWRIGFARPFDAVCAPSSAAVTVLNTDGAYFPDASGSPVQVGDWLRITEATAGTLYAGRVRRVEGAAGDSGDRTLTIHASGPEADLAESLVMLPLYLNLRTGDLIHALLVSAASTGAARSIDDGLTALAYAGDTWWNGIMALDGIREAAEAEGGRFFTQRDGTLTFYDRHRLIRDTTVRAAFDGGGAALEYDHGGGLVNCVRLLIRPRVLGVDQTPVWTLSTSHRVPVGISSMIASFRSADGQPIGSVHVYDMTPGTDYSVNTQRDGSGADVTAQVALTFDSVAATGVLVRITNNSGVTAYLQAGAQILGQPLIASEVQVVEARDLAGMDAHGPRALVRHVPLLDAVAGADVMARAELDRRRTPRTALRSLRVTGHSHAADALTLTLLDSIRISDAHSGHDGYYRIISEAHRLERGGLHHRVTWGLEPDDGRLYWALGTGALDVSTRLVY